MKGSNGEGVSIAECRRDGEMLQLLSFPDQSVAIAKGDIWGDKGEQQNARTCFSLFAEMAQPKSDVRGPR